MAPKAIMAPKMKSENVTLAGRIPLVIERQCLGTFLASSAAQQPDAVLAVVAGYRSESVENPPFVLLGRLLVSVPDRCHKFILRHLAEASAHVAASRVFDNILFVE